MSDTDFENMQGIHIDNNFKCDYKFCEGSEVYVNIMRGSAKYHLERNAQLACMLRVQRYTYFENNYIYIYINQKYIYIYIYIYINQIRNTGNVLKCGAGEGWRRSDGPIVWKMKKHYIEQGGKKYPTYSKKKEGLRNGHILSRNSPLKDVIEGEIEGRWK
jgi:hypothetical protein